MNEQLPPLPYPQLDSVPAFTEPGYTADQMRDYVRAALAAQGVPEAMATVTAAMKADPDYAWSWHCNVAMSFVDAGGDHYTANQGAARFLRLLAGVEPAHELPAPPEVPEAAQGVPVDPCLVLWQAMNEAEKVGNRTDDKLIVKFLRDAGYRIAPAPAPEAVKRCAICHETEQICSACPTRGVACEAATPAQAQQAAEPHEIDIVRAAVAAMPSANPELADDLLSGFTMHTEMVDVVAIYRAGMAATTTKKDDMKDYIAGKAEFRYPFAGDERPAGGAQVLLLTEGGICVRGTWDNSGAFHAWAPMPDTDKAKQRATKVAIAGLKR